MSGHSKWSQIRHRKGAADAKRGQLFGKLIREITVAAREAGVNPDINVRLRAAMERGKKEGLPKDNIERALERTSGKGDAGALFEFLYEATAAHGVMILIEGITDSKNRTLAEIKHTLTERDGRLAKQGSLIWNFEKVGALVAALAPSGGRSREERELAIIEAGASDFHIEDDTMLIETPFAERERVRETLEGQGIAITESGHDFKPRAPLALAPEARNAVESLLDVLTEHDDVQEVYTNLPSL